MGKYAAALGVWQHKLVGNNGVEIEMSLTPKMGDNDKVGKILSAAGNHKDSSRTLKEVQDLYVTWVQREDSTLTEEDVSELKTLVELNQAKILEMITIEFKWADEEQINKIKEKQGDSTKN
jgi:succinate dehydrogenase flavin-adding protein (antitoxin of CptAB toxin-antitoxin module)